MSERLPRREPCSCHRTGCLCRCQCCGWRDCFPSGCHRLWEQKRGGFRREGASEDDRKELRRAEDSVEPRQCNRGVTQPEALPKILTHPTVPHSQSNVFIYLYSKLSKVKTQMNTQVVKSIRVRLERHRKMHHVPGRLILRCLRQPPPHILPTHCDPQSTFTPTFHQHALSKCFDWADSLQNWG